VTGFQFNADARAFDLENACQLAAAAELVYQPALEVKRHVTGIWGMQRVSFFDVSGTQLLVAANDELILVCFRGTEPDQLDDWITDSRVEMVPGPMGGRVHAGFYNALSHVWQQVTNQVAELTAARTRPLWVTGHSLGAALATLATARWLDAGRKVQGLYTFGQPRTGDEQFARHFNFAFKPYAYRLVNHNDLVTRVPPRALGYSHTGTFKYFTERGELVDDINWWQRFLDSWQYALDDFFDWARDGVRDHNMTQYRELLARTARTASRNWNDQWLKFIRVAVQRAA